MNATQNKCPNCGAGLNIPFGGTMQCHYCGGTFNLTAPVPAPVQTISNIENEDLDAHDAAEDDESYIIYNGPQVYYPPVNLVDSPPERSKIFTKNIKYGFSLWVIWGLIRGTLPVFFGQAYEIDAPYTDRLFYAHIGSFYYCIGALLFIFGFPLLMATVFYLKLTAKYSKF